MNIELKRQLVHASGILLIILLQIFGQFIASIMFFTMFLFLALWGHFRKSGIKLKALAKIEDFMISQLKMYERQNEYFSGAAIYFFGIFIATALFPFDVAVACIAVLAASDAVSTLVGKLYGRHKLPINRDKSWEGSIAFFLMTFVILWLFNPMKALYIAPIVTFVEMLPYMDDNLTIPICVGLLFLI